MIPPCTRVLSENWSMKIYRPLCPQINETGVGMGPIHGDRVCNSLLKKNHWGKCQFDSELRIIINRVLAWITPIIRPFLLVSHILPPFTALGTKELRFLNRGIFYKNISTNRSDRILIVVMRLRWKYAFKNAS